MNSKNKHLFGFLLVIYTLSMLWLLLGQRITPGMTFQYHPPTPDRMNLKPFATVDLYLYLLKNTKDQDLLIHSVVNLVGNVVMFIPLGFLLPKTFRPMRIYPLMVLCVAAGIVFIEILQLITGLGSCDVDDLILNVIGANMGYLIYLIWRRKTK